MNRRQFIGAASLGFTAPLAGCLGDDDSNNSDGNSNDGSEDTGSSNPDADWEESFDAAVEALAANQADLEAYADDEASWESEQLISRIEDGESHLDGVASKTSAVDAEVAVLRELAVYQREAVEYTRLSDELDSCLETMDAYIEMERWSDANDHFQSCRTTVEDLREQFDATRMAFVGIDVEALVDADVESPPSETIGTTRAEFDAIVTTMDGLGAFLEGSLDVMDGLEAFETERYEDASTRFGEAKTPLHASDFLFRELEDDSDVPGELLPDVIELTCLSSAMATASEYFELAALEASRGNLDTADGYIDAGAAELDQCG